MKCLVIEPSGVLWEKEAPEIDLEVLTGLVGGPIEALPSSIAEHIMYINEEGSVLRLPPNPYATALAILAGLTTEQIPIVLITGIVAAQYLLGVMVIGGPLDEDGKHRDVDPDFKAQVIDIISQYTKED